VVDGNFKADHIKQKNEADDVHLTNGQGFCTAPGPYHEHIKAAKVANASIKEVSGPETGLPWGICNHYVFRSQPATNIMFPGMSKKLGSGETFRE
jgi:hypothetical protein